MRPWILFALIAVLPMTPLVSAQPASEENRTYFEVYSVGFTDMDAAEAMVRTMIGDQGNVARDPVNRRLLVVTTKARHASIADMLEKLDVPPSNVRIDVSFRGSSSGRDRAASVSGEGLVIHEDGITHTRIRLRPELVDQTTTASSDVMQTLTVASGREGILRIGESVPYIDWLVNYGCQWGYLTQRVQWQEVGSQLVVEPVIVGNGPLIRIRLTPELSGLVNGNPLRTRFSRVSTEVVVQDGQTFQIGGLDQDQEFYSRFLVGFNRSGTQEALDISLTAHIIGNRNSP